jgi:hypothetical protein
MSEPKLPPKLNLRSLSPSPRSTLNHQTAFFDAVHNGHVAEAAALHDMMSEQDAYNALLIAVRRNDVSMYTTLLHKTRVCMSLAPFWEAACHANAEAIVDLFLANGDGDLEAGAVYAEEFGHLDLANRLRAVTRSGDD